MPRTRPPYPDAFRQQIIELARAGRSVAELAEEFEPSDQTIRSWIRQADIDGGSRSDGATTAEREELRWLKQENRRLKQERDILAKAAAWFARETDAVPERSSRSREAHQALFSIAAMCRVLEVSPSGYYAWRDRKPSVRDREDAVLTEQIRAVHDRSRGTYGAPRVHAELRAQGVRVGRKRVARLMRAAGLAGVSRRRGSATTVRQSEARPAPDLVERDFSAEAPDQLWVADITYVPTRGGFLYLAVVLDAFSRRVVGWQMAGHLRTELVTGALEMALQQRCPDKVIHHSDQGCQYTSVAFGQQCRRAGVRPSMGSVGDCSRQRHVRELLCYPLRMRTHRSRGVCYES